MIDRAEDRQLFSQQLDEISIKQAPWHSVTNIVIIYFLKRICFT